MCGFSSLLHPVASASPALWPVSQRAGLHECRLQSGFRPRAAWSRLVFLHALILFLFTAVGPMFSSDIAADGPQLSILSANVTSMRKNFAIIRGIDSSYSLLQETTLNIHGQSSMRKVLHRTGYDALLGPPCGFKLSGSQFQHCVEFKVRRLSHCCPAAFAVQKHCLHISSFHIRQMHFDMDPHGHWCSRVICLEVQL